jgi:hypothetical protein
MDINIYEQKSKIEVNIRQLKLKLYEMEFELSEIKNYIRKNCIHEWSKTNTVTDLELGYLHTNKQTCVKCDDTHNEAVELA